MITPKAGSETIQSAGRRPYSPPVGGELTTLSIGGGRPIQVKGFSDRRHPQAPVPGGDRIDTTVVGSVHGLSPLASDGMWVTGLFLNALRAAGYDPIPQPTADALDWHCASEVAVLEGCIWRFHFQATPTPVLDADIALVLRDSLGARILWRSDFPAEEAGPIWVGLGCRAEAMLPAAISEVEGAATLLFRSKLFSRAMQLTAGPAPPASPHVGDSHKVIPAGTWTAAEEGRITASAHESGTVAPGAHPAGAARADAVTNRKAGALRQKAQPAGAS